MARFDKTRRKYIRKILPPIRCAGHCRDGSQCKRYAVIGATVCWRHGAGAPQVRAKAEERITLAEALAREDPRHPWDVMEDTLHIADVLMRQVLQEVKAKGAVSPQLLDKLISAIERANRLSKTVLDAGVAERRTRLAEGQAQQIHAFVSRVLSGLDLTPAQQALVPHLIKREVEGMVVPDRRAIAA